MLVPENNGRKILQTKKTWIVLKEFFADKYHKINLTQKLSAGQTGYHSANSVVPTGVIASLLNNLTFSTTVEQSHLD